MTLPSGDPAGNRPIFSWGTKDVSDKFEMNGDHAMQGPFVLSGPVSKGDQSHLPMRGDLAHIALAGKYFVPHYVVPQPRGVMPGGATIHREPAETSDEVCSLMEGDSFEVLDVAGSWAWGCLGPEGPVGYVHIDRLEPVVE